MESNTCENCKHLWSYSPDMSSPYGELACTKGHWEGIENPSDLAEPIECEDYHDGH